MIAHVGLCACLCNLTWDNVKACKIQGSCKFLESSRWHCFLFMFHFTAKGEGLCPTPGAGEVLWSETGQINLPSSLLVGPGWVASWQSSARWRAGPVCEGKCPFSVTHSVFLALFPTSKMLLVLGSAVGAWMGVQMDVWGWGLAFVDRQTGSLNLHKPCVCSGTGYCFCLAKSRSVRHKTGEPACGEALSAHAWCVVGEADMQTCIPGSEKHICTWPEKSFACGTVRLQTRVDCHATLKNWHFRRKNLCSGVFWQLLEQHQHKAPSSHSVHIRCHRGIIEIFPAVYGQTLWVAEPLTEGLSENCGIWNTAEEDLGRAAHQVMISAECFWGPAPVAMVNTLSALWELSAFWWTRKWAKCLVILLSNRSLQSLNRVSFQDSSLSGYLLSLR